MSTVTESSSLSGALLPPLSSMPMHGRTVRLADAQGSMSDLVLSDVLFRDALVRERRRADRFEETFVLALISRDEREALTGSWERVVTALSVDAFRGDLLGWFEDGRVLGLIRSAGPGDAAGDGATLAGTTRRDLQCVTDGLEDCSVNIETYDPSGDTVPAWLMADAARLAGVANLSRRVAKRALDLIGSAILLALLAPVMAAIAVLIKATSPGRVFFKQERVGAGGRIFRMIKFRTIRTDADATIHQQYVESFIEAGGRPPEGGETVRKIVNDPRVTSIGRFLRGSSLDEVPQFWNVLVGEMSLVGPRPPLPYEVARYKSWHRRRVLEAKPGMTGLWQVTGRSRTTFDEMVRLDLRYARNCTVVNDLRILLATPRAVLSGKGAH